MEVFTSQLNTYARICSKYNDFKEKAITLIKKLKNQGYYFADLRRLSLKFFNEKSDIIDKYNILNGNIFLRDLFEGVR